MSEKDERLYSLLGHVLTPLFYVLPALVVWLIGKDKSSFVDRHGKEALNFAILYTIVQVINWFLVFIFIGFLTGTIVFVLAVIWCIQAAMKANAGEEYKYPVNWRIIK